MSRMWNTGQAQIQLKKVTPLPDVTEPGQIVSQRDEVELSLLALILTHGHHRIELLGDTPASTPPGQAHHESRIGGGFPRSS